ncbi:hypothetical protein G7085_10070 [Tessaracoccus sp. HDW20]|uniref:hypothetical protein n=1 Tax=Tessaracoccus coleopterorum TaxID=2714950 RepID=UPI0018D3FEA5|nr:hypothetical protein [Tessaracoccus coleopterorum]NHB84825.1 hypothetical protein [Tessaracoccus coleopterorum]
MLDVLPGRTALIVRMRDVEAANPRFAMAAVTTAGELDWVWRDSGESLSFTRIGRRLVTVAPTAP